MQSSQRRTILITGANKGIGYAVVERLLSESTPYDIILTSRDVRLGQQALSSLQSKYPKSASTLTYHQLDVNDDASVETLVASVKNLNIQIDVLINNAGVLYHNSNDDQKRLTVQTNFFSVVKLTERLLPFMAEDGKILEVSSLLGQLQFQGETLRNALSDPNLTEEQLYDIANKLIELTPDFKPVSIADESSYPGSKALLNAYVRYFLPSKVKETQQVYAIHPGWIRTELGGEDATGSLEDGADTIVYLTSLPFKKNSELNARLISDRKVIDF